MPPKKAAAAAPPISVKPNALKGKSVIITGEIDGLKRKDAEQILIDAGATIEKSLNKKVQLVVLGADAGPKKLEKIEQLGLETKEWDDLIGEIKGDGDKAKGEEADGDDAGDEEMEEDEEVEEEPKPKAKPKAKANTKAKADPAPKAKAKAKAKTSSSDSPVSGKTVIITGTIPGHDRKSANTVVEDAGASVAKSLNKQVELVILGTNAGPDKLKKVEELGVETITWAELAEKLGIEVAPEKEVADVEPSEAPESIDGLTVIISGTVEGYTRSAAQKLLEGAGATYAKSLNKSVELVILGTNAGPDKLNKIAELEIPTCTFEALQEKLGFEEPPKKKAKKN